MPQENAEIVRRWIWAFENDEELFRELTDPVVEWAPFEDNHTVYRGIAAALQIRARWLDSWADHRIEFEELLARGEDVLASLHIVARGRASGAEVDIHLYGHLKVRDGRIIYLFEHEDRAAAARAVGLID